MARETISAKEALKRLHETGDISNCVIIGKLNTSNQVFKNTVFAEGAKFEDEVSWFKTTFEEKVFYNDAVFCGRTSWAGAHFKKNAWWLRTMFYCNIFFGNAIFDHDACWDEAIFKDKILASSKEIWEILQGTKAGVYISLEDYRKG